MHSSCSLWALFVVMRCSHVSVAIASIGLMHALRQLMASASAIHGTGNISRAYAALHLPFYLTPKLADIVGELLGVSAREICMSH